MKVGFLPKKSVPGQVSIKEVAKAANVSLMTVSRSMRGLNGVSDETRRQVLQIARDLNYVPNHNARALAMTNSSLIGISLPTLFNDVFADILLGMRRTFEQAGYSSLVQTTDYQTDRETSWAEQLLAWRPAAIILTGVDHDPKLRERLQAEGLPVLQIWDVTPDPIDICVGIDHYAAGLDLGQYVAGLGYRKPAFVGPQAGSDPRADKRFAGLSAAFSFAGINGIDRIVVEQDNAFLMGHRGFEAMRNRPTPDVMFFLNDHMAFGGMMGAERAGLLVPQDIGIVGFNGLDLTTVLPAKMTTICTPRRQIGLIGARHLLARLHGVTPEPVTCLPCKLVAGQTTQQQ
ncbi:MAG: LacI family gluconate utilization system Gnt-I transcriptional repressor [Pseudorhodobacter sp.]|jgi:LacI family gluconate utilization system Gnt-I transcriptional repressor